MYPRSLDLLIQSFQKLPGVGRKTAERYAYYVVSKFSEEEVQNFILNLDRSIHNIKRCPSCGFLTENDLCDYCMDESRDKSKVLVVEEPKDVEAIERCGNYNGIYHVLNGSISPINGIGPDELNISSLIEKVRLNKINEVIVATSATVEGEATSLYLGRILKPYNIVVSRIAYGMPVGSSLEYNDETTIMRAIEGRKKI